LALERRRKKRFLKKARKNFWFASRGFGAAKAARSEPKVLAIMHN